MRPWIPILAILPLLGGCTHAHLRHSTVKQTSTLSELQYRQVLDNVAMFVDNPHALPHFAMTGGGATAVGTNGGAGVTLTWNPFTLVAEVLNLNAQRSLTQNWTLAAILDPDRLAAMRCAYQLAILGETIDCDDCHKALVPYLGEQYLQQIPPGWFQVGCWLDVPKHACYVGRFKHRWVWVTPDGLDGLTRFTLVILDIATAAPTLPPAVPTKVVEAYFYDEAGTLVTRETQTVPASTPARVPVRATPPIAPRLNYFNPILTEVQLGRPQ